MLENFFLLMVGILYIKYKFFCWVCLFRVNSSYKENYMLVFLGC